MIKTSKTIRRRTAFVARQYQAALDMHWSDGQETLCGYLDMLGLALADETPVGAIEKLQHSKTLQQHPYYRGASKAYREGLRLAIEWLVVPVPTTPDPLP